MDTLTEKNNKVLRSFIIDYFPKISGSAGRLPRKYRVFFLIKTQVTELKSIFLIGKNKGISRKISGKLREIFRNA
jgi:hypothetical protein